MYLQKFNKIRFSKHPFFYGALLLFSNIYAVQNQAELIQEGKSLTALAKPMLANVLWYREPKPVEEPVPTPCIGSLTVRHIERGGVGYKEGYSTLEGLVFPIRSTNYIWPFLDLRFHRFDNNEIAANGGLGFRYNAFHNKIIFGLNTYFDYRSDHDHRFHFPQIGCGFEMLSRALDLRVNGYFPLKKEKTIRHCVFDHYQGGFIMSRKKVEVALEGVDLEIGRSLRQTNLIDLYAAIGPYYYGGNACRHTIGGRFRLNLNIYDYFFIDGILSYDHLYKTKAQGQIRFNFPIGCTSEKTRMRKKLTQPIQRHEIIVLSKYCKWKKNF